MTNEEANGLAERLKAYCQWSGWYGTAPEPDQYPETTASSLPMDDRLVVVSLISAAILAAERGVWEQAADIAEKFGVHPQLNIANGGPEWYRHGKDIATKLRAQASQAAQPVRLEPIDSIGT